MRKIKTSFLFFICFLLINALSFAQTFSPGQLSGLTLWLRADSNITYSTTVSAWNDCSGNGYHSAQTTTSYQPVYYSSVSTLNNKPAVHFDGTNDVLQGVTIPNINTSSFSIFILARNNPNTAYKGMFSINSTSAIILKRNTGTFSFQQTPSELHTNNTNDCSNSGTQFKIYSVTKNYGVVSKLYVNSLIGSSSTTTGVVNTFTNGIYRVGYAGSSIVYWDGDIAEIIMYNTILSDNDRQYVEQYLMDKYSKKISLGADFIQYGFCDTTLSAGSGFSNYLWSTGDTTGSINVSKTGTYWVRAYDIFGRMTTDTITITFPERKLNFQDTTICFGDTLVVRPITPGLSHYSLLWSDASTDTVLHISQAGSYYVKITDTTGCFTYSDTIHVSVNNFSGEATLGNDTAFCAGNTLALFHPGYTVSSYLWTGGYTGSNLAVTATGDYWVQASDINGCIVRDTVHVTVMGTAPVVLFLSDSVCLSDTTHFSDLSSAVSPDTIVSWQWSFGDNSASSQQHPDHLYLATGTYNVSLTTMTNSGCAASYSTPVIVYPLPQATFSSVPLSCTNTQNQFTDMSLSPPGYSLSAWDWDFGDNQTSSLQNPLHFYADSGIYNITLTVFTNKGCADTAVSGILIKSPLSPPPGNFLLMTPDNNTIVDDTMVHFSWELSHDAHRYALQLAEDISFTLNVILFDSIYTTSFDASIGLTPKYWRVIAYNICNTATFSDKRFISYFAPPVISGLKLWLKADTVILNNTTINTWPDLSGNGYHAAQATAAYQPLYYASVPALNNKPAIHFDGTNDVLQGGTIPNINTSSFSIFILARNNPNTANKGMFSINGISAMMLKNNTGTFAFQQSYTDLHTSNTNDCSNSGTQFKIYSVTKNFGVITKLYVNAILGSSSTNTGVINTFTNGIYRVGYAGSAIVYWDGDIAEIIMYDTILSDNNRQYVEQYLMDKYTRKITLSSVVIPYGFCDTALSAGSGLYNYLWSTGDTTASIAANRTGTYWVRAYDIFGRITSDTVNITFPERRLNFQDTTICFGDTLHVRPLTPDLSHYSLLWSDASTDTVLHITQAGSYYVKITDTTGCFTYSDTIHVTVNNFPIEATLGNDTAFCAGNTLALFHPGYTVSSYLWTGGYSGSNLAITTTGDYWIQATDVMGCVARDTIHVNIIGTAPVAMFSADSICFSDTTHFTDLSTAVFPDNIITWQWSFGDGQSSADQNPAHWYNAPGTYNVGLTTLTSVGCSGSQSFPVIVYSLPQALFSSVPLSCTNTQNQFTDLSLPPQGDSLSGWNWNFGDNQSSSLQNPVHFYTNSGAYTILLSVYTDKGCSDTAASAIVVESPLAPAPGNFSLLAPADNITVDDTVVHFSWEPSAGTYHYTLQLAEDPNFTMNVITYDSIFSTGFTAGIGFTPKYWRVRAYNICNVFTNSAETRKIYYFAPPAISGLSLWLKADTVILNGTTVSSWPDCSGYGYNAVQTTVANQPIYYDSVSSLNEKPCIHFDGINDLFNGVTIPDIDSSSLSIFILARNNANTTYRGMFSINDIAAMILKRTTGTFSFQQTTSALQTSNTEDCSNSGTHFRMYSVMKKLGVEAKLYVNSVLGSSSTTTGVVNVFTNGIYKVGCGFGSVQNWLGDIAEIILYNDALSDSNRLNIEQYFRNKYAPPVRLGADINIPYGFCNTVLDAGTRFTHYLWSTGDTTQTLALNQSGTYSVTVTDIFGFLSSDTVQVNMPTFYNIQDTGLCLGDTLGFSVNLGNDYTYLWLPDSVTTGHYSIATAGTYSVIVSDTIGCSRTLTFTVTVDSFPVQAGLGPDRTICQGDHIGLVNGAQQAVSYLWSDNSGNSYLPITSPPGTMPVYAVTVTNINGCIARDTIILTVNGVMPVVSFTNDSVCFGNETHFTDLSSVAPPFSIASRLWDFGDFTSSILQNPAHVYPDDGVFNVHLTVVTDSGCTKTIQKDVKVFSIPDVSFLPYMGCSGVSVSFEDNTLCPYGNLAEWQWDFGDTYGSGDDTSGIQNPVYTYDSSGSYTVKLITVSDAGCSDSAEQIITIRESAAVDFQYSSACAGQLVYFNDQTVLPPWETIIEFEWHFGDGTSSSISNPSHAYDTAGIYNVTLTIKTLNGCKVSVTRQVIIGAVPEASFGYTGSCIFTTALFTDSSTSTLGTIDHWDWDFGGIGASSDQNPAFVFPDTGIYNVALKINTEYGCSDSVVVPVRVYPAPVAGFTLTPEYGIPPLPVSFTNLSTGANNYVWNFGDGDTDFSTDPVHTYLSQGIFDVLLTAYNITGCYDTVSHKVYVLPTTVDVEVLNTSCVLAGNILTISADLMNAGSRKIEHIDVSMQLENGNIIHEPWYGALMQGQKVHYVFKSQPEVPAGQNVDYVCVTASLAPELEENDLSDNKNCAVLNGNFTFSDPYPNPVINNLVLEYVLPFTDVVTIELFTEMGEKVKELFRGERPEGYSAHTFDLSALNAGVYIVKITFHDNVLRKKFVKL